MQLTVEVQEWDTAGSAPISLTIDTGGIDIGGTTNGGAASSESATITDNGSVDITITQTGYKPYAVTIDNVYEADTVISILLVEDITDTNDPEYLMPHPYIFTFRDPCSFNVDIYTASSYVGAISWYLNDVELTDQTNNAKFTQEFTTVGDYQIKLASVTQQLVGNSWENAWLRQWASPIVHETGNTVIGVNATAADLVTYLALDTNTNTTITEYRPTFSLVVSEPTDEIDETTCYTQYENVTVTSDIVLNRAGAVTSQHTVDWTVNDPDGLPIATSSQSLALAVNDITFSADSLGFYTITTVLTDIVCNTVWTRVVTISTCNFVYLDTTGVCGEFNIYNMSNAYDITYDIELIGGNGANDITGSIPANTTSGTGASNLVTLIDAGISSVTVIWYTDVNDPTTKQTQVLVINNWCLIWDCLAGYVNEVLCKPESLCNPCPDSLILNEMLLFNQTYSMMMNTEYEFNNFYSLLDETKLAEFQTMNKLYDKMAELCARLSCSSPYLSVTQKDTSFSFGMKGKSSKATSGGCGCS